MSTIKVNSDTIKGYKNYFDSEKNYFSNTSYYTLSNSYLSSCSDATVQSMYSNLNDIYSKINTLYNSINTYWEEYISDFNTLETSIETCDNVCTNASVSSYLSGFISILSNEDTQATEMGEKEAAFYIKRALSSIGMKFLNIENDYPMLGDNFDYVTIDDVIHYRDKYLGWISIFMPVDFDSWTIMCTVYIKAIEEKYGTDLSDEDFKFIFQNLLIEDSKHDFKLLNSKPLLVNDEVSLINPILGGTEDYNYKGETLYYYNQYGMKVTSPLASFTISEEDEISFTEMTAEQKEKYIKAVNKYYLDIMDETKKYSSSYKEKTVENTNNLTLIYIDQENSKNIGYAAFCRKNPNNSSNVNIRTDLFYNIDTSLTHSYSDMIVGFNHELAHAYDHSLFDGKNVYTKQSEWQTIYKQFIDNPSHESFSEPVSNSDVEYFAVIMAEYYNYKDKEQKDNTYSMEGIELVEKGSSNPLKMIEIDVTTKEGKHYTNLYDYVDQEIAN